MHKYGTAHTGICTSAKFSLAMEMRYLPLSMVQATSARPPLIGRPISLVNRQASFSVCFSISWRNRSAMPRRSSRVVLLNRWKAFRDRCSLSSSSWFEGIWRVATAEPSMGLRSAYDVTSYPPYCSLNIWGHCVNQSSGRFQSTVTYESQVPHRSSSSL